MQYLSRKNIHFWGLNALHYCNDGMEAALLVFLPFIVAAQGKALDTVGLMGFILKSTTFTSLVVVSCAYRSSDTRAILSATVFYIFGYFLLSLSVRPFLTYLAISLAGLGFGAFHSIGFSLVGRWANEGELGRALGRFTAIGELGKISYTAIVSSFVLYLGLSGAALCYALSSALIVSCAAVTFQFSNRQDEPFGTDTTQNHLGLLLKACNRKILFLLSAVGLDEAANYCVILFLPFILAEKGVDAQILGPVMAGFLTCNLFGKLMLGGLTDRFSPPTIFVICEAAMVSLIGLLVISDGIYLTITASCLLGLFIKGTTPVSIMMTSNVCREHLPSRLAFSLREGTSVLVSAMVVHPIAILASSYGITTAFYAAAALCFLAALSALKLPL